MATLRPAVKEDDNYVLKIIKYMPAEIVAGYTALTGYLAVPPGTPIPGEYVGYYIGLVCTLLVITPIWMYYATLDSETPVDPNKKKKAIFHACIATLAFAIWVYAVGNPLLEAVICCQKTPTATPDCDQYSPVLGSIILVLFTIITPLVERIVFGPKSGSGES